MAASEAAVTAVMERLGCKRSRIRVDQSWCEHPAHAEENWTNRGCPVAAAAADAAVDADRASIQAEALRESADHAEDVGAVKSGDQMWLSYLRDRADRIEAQS